MKGTSASKTCLYAAIISVTVILGLVGLFGLTLVM